MNYKILFICTLIYEINAIELPSYEAKYSYESDEISIEGIREFSKNSSDLSLGFKARNFLASMSFKSKFTIEDSQVISQNYIISVRPKFINRDQEIAFNYLDQTVSSVGKDSWKQSLNNIQSADPLNAQIQIRINLLKGMKEFSIKLLEIKNGNMEDNFYKVIESESCSLGEDNFECIVLKRFREKENRETLYYLIPDLDYMFFKIIDTGPESKQKLELLEILSFG